MVYALYVYLMGTEAQKKAITDRYESATVHKNIYNKTRAIRGVINWL